MFCTKCGKQLPEGARFCIGCGTAVAAMPVVAPVAPAEPVVPVGPSVPAETFVPAEPVASAEPVYTEPALEQEETVLEEGTQNTGEEPVLIPEEPKKKSRKARLILLAVVSLALVVLVVGLVSVIRAASTPEAKLLRAARKSGEEFAALMSTSGNFTGMFENLGNLEEGYTMKLAISSEMSYGEDFSTESNMGLVLSSSMKNKETQALVNINTAYSYSKYNRGENAVQVSIYANEEELVLSLPDTLEGCYSLPTKDLGEQLFNSALGEILREELDRKTRKALECLDLELYAQPDLEAFKKAYPDEYKAFVQSILLEESKEKIPLADGEMEVYSLSCNLEAAGNLFLAYREYTTNLTYGQGMAEYMDDDLDELLDLLEDAEFVAYFGIQDGCLTALHVETWKEDEESSFTFLLEGKENIWEDFVLLADGEAVMEGGLEQTKDGFELYLDNGDEELSILCDDPACELVFRSGIEKTVLDYGSENGGLQIFYDDFNSYGVMGDYEASDSRIAISLEILPMEPIEKPEQSTDLLDLTKEELEELEDDIEYALS